MFEFRRQGSVGLAVAVVGLVATAAALFWKPATIRHATPQPAALVSVSPRALAAPGSAPSRTVAQVASAAPAADPGLTIKRILPISGPIRYGEWHWDDANVPAGPTVITVDLDARVLSVFRGGYEIGATAVLLGTTEKPTPLGDFPITQKDADHKSNIYDGAPMPYMLRMTNDGVTIHGTKVQNGYASHGCVGVPTPFARKLFGVASLGDRVYVTRGKHSAIGDALT